MTAPLISERVRCACCPAETSLATLETAPTTMGWTELEGFRFCETCSPRAADVVALDRERNAHQRTIGQLERLRERTLSEERVRKVVRLAAADRLVITSLAALGPASFAGIVHDIATRAAKELAGATVGLSTARVVDFTEDQLRSVVEQIAAEELSSRGHGDEPWDDGDYAAAIGARVAAQLAGAMIEMTLHDAPLSTAFDRAAIAITGQSAAALTEHFKPATASIGPADIAIIDRALECFARTYKHSRAERADIERIRALLASPRDGQ